MKWNMDHDHTIVQNSVSMLLWNSQHQRLYKPVNTKGLVYALLDYGVRRDDLLLVLHDMLSIVSIRGVLF